MTRQICRGDEKMNNNNKSFTMLEWKKTEEFLEIWVEEGTWFIISSHISSDISGRRKTIYIPIKDIDMEATCWGSEEYEGRTYLKITLIDKEIVLWGEPTEISELFFAIAEM